MPVYHCYASRVLEATLDPPHLAIEDLFEDLQASTERAAARLFRAKHGTWPQEIDGRDVLVCDACHTVLDAGDLAELSHPAFGPLDDPVWCPGCQRNQEKAR